jgi:hypothetical protein
MGMTSGIALATAARLRAIAASGHLIAQCASGARTSGALTCPEPTSWGDRDLQREWTERFTRRGRDAIHYLVTFVDAARWTAQWAAALDVKGRPAECGVFEHAYHERNYGMSNMPSAARVLESAAGGRRSSRRSQPQRWAADAILP